MDVTLYLLVPAMLLLSFTTQLTCVCLSGYCSVLVQSLCQWGRRLQHQTCSLPCVGGQQVGIKQMDSWTRPGVAATLWPKRNWMMETENLLITLPPFLSPSLWTTQDQRTLLQITDDTHGYMGSKWLTPPAQTLPFFPNCSALSPEIVWVNFKPLDSISIAVTDNVFFRLLDGCEKHSCPFHSHVSVFALCLNSSSVVRLSFSSDCRDQFPPCRFEP